MDSIAIVMNTAGGLALFLYGLRVLSSALKRAIGEKMRVLLERLTGKAYRGVIVGAVTSGILQSSSMTMVLLIGLINAGALKLAQGIGVMLGSEIGTTLTAQLIAFKLGNYYLPIIAIGFLLSEIFRGKRTGDVGRIVLGFGILFLGMSILSGGLKSVAQSNTVLNLLEACGSNVFVGVLVGAIVTAIIQSSSAMTALVIAMGAAGILTLPAAIALLQALGHGAVARQRTRSSCLHPVHPVVRKQGCTNISIATTADRQCAHVLQCRSYLGPHSVRRWTGLVGQANHPRQRSQSNGGSPVLGNRIPGHAFGCTEPGASRASSHGRHG